MGQSENINGTNVNRASTKEILYDGNLYDVTTFLSRHPGGQEIILNFTEVGEDATLAIQQFHSRSIDKVLTMMKSLPNRPEPQIELSKESEQIKQRNEAMTTDFVNLYKEFLEEKLFEPSFSHWIYRIVEWIALGLLGFSLITESSDFFSKFFGSFVLTMAMGRGAWVMHEFGHFSGTGNPTSDRLLHEIVIGVSMGNSAIWWRRYHSLHHAMTNRVPNDSNVQPLAGLFLFNENILKDPAKDQTFFERHQIFFLPLYPIIFYFQWMSLDTFTFLYREKRIVELISIIIHYLIMYQLGFQMWLLTASLFALYFFSNLILSHSFVPVIHEPTHWVEQTFVGTVNMTPGRFVDWWTGYLNYQIEHHLFPTMPEINCPLIVDRVKALAEKHGLPYHVDSYMLTGMKALTNVKRVSDILKHIG